MIERTSLPPHPTSQRWRARRPWASLGKVRHLTIRRKILLAFLAMSAVTAAVGAHGVHGIGLAGALVVETFDRSLMATSYARSAAAAFAAMETAAARGGLAAAPGGSERLGDEIGEAARSLREDLEVAADRSSSADAKLVAQQAQRAADAWEAAVVGKLRQPGAGPAGWAELGPAAASVREGIDLLVNHTAGDAFAHRERALRTIAASERLSVTGTLVSLLLSAAITVLLARRITGPVADASAAAARIAAGDLSTPIPRPGKDELGALLTAMATMRDSIRRTLEGEVAQRRSAQARLSDAVESSREGVLLVDGEGRIVTLNSQFAAFFPALEDLLVVGARVSDIGAEALARDALPARAEPETAFCRAWSAVLLPTGEQRLRDGRWLRVSRSPTREGGFVAFCSDVTLLKDREAELRQTNACFEAALGSMSQGLCLFDASHRVKVVNPQFSSIYGVPAGRIRPGTTLREVVELTVHSSEHRPGGDAELRAEQELLIKRRPKGSSLEQLADGRVIAISHEPLAEGGWVATYEDITERRRFEARLSFMARHDALTGLPNRVLFLERLAHAVAQLDRSQAFAVLCLDLNHFKSVNDVFGHPTGDKLLRLVAKRLQGCVRETDTVARLGGDEFAIVQTGIAEAEAAGALARRVIAEVSQPYDLDGHAVTVGTSVGIALAPADGREGEELLKNADIALYRAKSEERGTLRFFEPGMTERLQARRALELDLRAALRDDELRVHFQPLVDIPTGAISGFEALVRWRHPTRGMVPPAEFIPVAEEVGLIFPLGELVLRQACAEAASWPRHVKVAVNVSPVQFKDQALVDRVVAALADTGLAPERLELEITESLLLQDSAAVLATLHRLRDLGVRIAMDDFGTGYSSLSYLRGFPVDKIKIDRSFVRDLATGGEAAAIVRAMTTLGASLGMRITAEGVETEEQLAALHAEGCTEAQGFLFSQARPAGEVAALLARFGRAEDRAA